MVAAKNTKAALARTLFEQGFNCAQAVAAAFAPEMGLDTETVLRLSSSFGGGMGGLRSVCGAVSGMFLVMGMLRGYSTADDPQAKAAHYAALQRLAGKMQERHGTLLCSELLKQHDIQPQSTPSQRNAVYYAKRPCAQYVEECAAFLEEALAPANMTN